MVSELSTSRTIFAGERSGAKFLMLCSTPLSKNEISFAVIGAAAPSVRTATTLTSDDELESGCERRPACANKLPASNTAVSPMAIDRHQRLPALANFECICGSTIELRKL